MEDIEIVELFQKRSEQAVSAASQKYGRYCKTIALNILQNNEDAEECVNDALLKCWESIPPNCPPVFSAYIARIVKNSAYDRLRQARREKRGGGEIEPVFEELSECISGNSSVEDELEFKELQKAIGEFLKSVNENHRRMFLLRYWYCFSVCEIAQRLGTSENAVSVTLSRLRRRIKDYLTKRGYDI
ncbi:MAG: sigma-70 family RNA polymerase sigma factor [Oscillospiraceae bacterium]|nr:sigma-70 family RNA polymerase sigma factor [Oscillospiraceae bacterium]